MNIEQKTESIRYLVEKIEKREIELPEFQRDFVWDVSQTYELYDSLVKGIFIGSIIYGIPSFEITTRELDNRPRKGTGSRKKLKITNYNRDQIKARTQVNEFKIILDGQQRVTSFYRSLKGTDEVWVVIKNDSELSKEIIKKGVSDRTLEECLFQITGSEDRERLSILLSDVFQFIQTPTMREEQKFEKLKATAFYIQSEEKLIEDTYLAFVHKISEILYSERILSYYLLDMNIEKFTLFFERSNSRGIQLSFIDILAAKLYAGFNLRQKIEAFEDEHPADGIPLNREVIVRAVAFKESGGVEVGRTYILEALTAKHFNDNWDSFCQYYATAVKFLHDQKYLTSISWIGYENILIPLIVFQDTRGTPGFSEISKFQVRCIEIWYWYSLLGQRYSIATNEIIIEDSKFMQGLVKNDFKRLRQFFFEINIA